MNYTIPTYTDEYAIRYDRNDDLYHCWHKETHLAKKNGKLAAYKALSLAAKFMTSTGAKEAAPVAKKSLLWTPPTPAVIAPLEEQLSALPSDAPRFVVIEAGYGTYHEQGYAVYDREKAKIVCPKHSGSWNFVLQERTYVDEDAAFFNAETPVEVEMDLYLFNQLLTESEKSEYPEIQLGSQEEATYRRQEAYWKERQTHTPSQPTKSEDPQQELTFVAAHQYQVGETITSKDGHTYIVIEKSWWLSQHEVDDMEDQDVFGAHAGWQTKARLK